MVFYFQNITFYGTIVITLNEGDTLDIRGCTFIDGGLEIRFNNMYAFQEVHEHFTENGERKSRSHWRVIHKETGDWVKYQAVGMPTLWYTVFNPFFKLDSQGRRDLFTNSEKLPMIIIDDIIPNGIRYSNPMPITFGDCTSAPTSPKPSYFEELERYIRPTKEQGNNPMRYDDMYGTTTSKSNTNVAGSSTVINMTNQSDESKQREYLLSEFDEATGYRDETRHKLVKQFNLNAPTIPTSSAAILDAFKNGKFTTDQAKVDLNTKFHANEGEDGDYEDRYDSDDKYIGAQYYGITFTDLPVADSKGYYAAMEEYETFKKNTKRAIIVGTPAEGLAALLALESWTPTTPTLH